MSETGRQSALGGVRLEDPAIAIFEPDVQAMFDLRISADASATRSAVSKALGFELPSNPRTSTTKGSISVLWLSIDQWLVVAPHEQRENLLDGISRAIAGDPAAITDMSAARAVLRLEGDGTREVIMKGGAANLLATDFTVGSVRRLNFAGIAALVHYRRAKPDSLDLYVFRSFAGYAIGWLEIAARPGAMISLFCASSPPPS